MRRWTLAVCATLLVIAGSGSAPTSADSGWYAIQDLGFPGEVSTATAVNADGVAVGYGGAAVAAPFLQQPGLGPQPLPVAGSTGTWPTAVNAAGQVALHGQSPAGYHAFRYDPGAASLVDLTPNRSSAQALGIDSAGRVVGYEMNGSTVAVRWSGSGNTVVASGGSFNAAFGSSDNGQYVVGFSGTSPFRWTAGGGLEPLANPGTMASALAVNDSGAAVGYALVGAAFTGVLWPAGGGDPILLPGFERAQDVNAHGDIVGYGPGAGGPRALLYRAGVVIDLNSQIDPASGWVLRKAMGINDAGQIVGEGSHDGLVRGFLLTPPVASDTTPPVITSVVATPDAIWPPNHQMVPVTLVVSATDDSGEPPVCAVTGVTSSEPDNAVGDGSTMPDTAIDGPLAVRVRAERSGSTAARIYTIAVACSDEAGNSATSNATVRVGEGSVDSQKRKR